MEAFFESYLKLLQDQHRQAEAALAGLPPAALNETTGNIRNSLCALACHIAGSEGYCTGEVIGGQSQGRNRDAEFAARDIPEAELVERIRRAAGIARQTVDGLQLADLDAKRTVWGRTGSREMSVGWVLMHVLEHTAYHAGQMSILRRRWLDRVG